MMQCMIARNGIGTKMAANGWRAATTPPTSAGAINGQVGKVRAAQQKRLRHPGRRHCYRAFRRHVRRRETDRRDAETRRYAASNALRSLEDDLPLEQFPSARRQERFKGAERTAVVPESTERLPPPQQPDRASADL